MKQTAVEWLHIEFQKIFPKETKEMYNNNQFSYENMIEQAKQMEKEQIVDAYGQGTADEAGEILDATKDAQQYYNKTYGK
jgi:serine/threonine protein phosphatase PrpC